MNTRTLAAAVVLASVSCAAASAQTALNELRAAAGPAAVAESIKIGGIEIGFTIENGRGRGEDRRDDDRRDWPRDRDGRSYGDGREEAAQACGRVPFED